MQNLTDISLIDKNHFPLFSAIQPEQVYTRLEQILDQNKKEINALLENKSTFSWDTLLKPLEDIDNRLHSFWSMVSHLNAVKNNEPLREAHDKCLLILSEYSTYIGQHKKLYEAIQFIADSPEFKTLESAKKKAIEHALRDFKLAGVHLPDKEKKAFAELQKKLSQLSSKFSNNLLDATNAWQKLITDPEQLKGIPESSMESFLQNAKENNQEGWLLSLDFPIYNAVITYCDNRELRKEIYTAFCTRASEIGPDKGKFDNTPVIKDILEARLQKAKLLGYKNFAELALVPKMANTTEEVTSFLNTLSNSSVDKARKEYEELKTFSKENLSIDDLSAWDIAYTSEKLRQHKYAITEEELRPYFSEECVLNGLFTVVNKLFGIQITELNNFDKWHKDVRFFKITDSDNNIRGYFYLDLYARPKKRGGAWMDDCRGRMILPDGTTQLPIAMLTCNLNRPTDNKPALFTHYEVETIFHEFGHGIHHMLTQIDVADTAGMNGVPWDAVEMPSQFLENWTWDKAALDLFAKHYETNEKLPDELFEKMLKAKNFQSAMQMVRQLEFSIFDFRLHMEFDPTIENQTQKILDEVRKEITVVPVPKFNRFQNSFSHIFAGGYAAGYYSYKWAEVLSADAFSKFEENGIFDEKTGREFLTIFLEQGGAFEPMDLFIQFRGRKPNPDALLRHTGINDEEHMQ